MGSRRGLPDKSGKGSELRCWVLRAEVLLSGGAAARHGRVGLNGSWPRVDRILDTRVVADILYPILVQDGHGWARWEAQRPGERLLRDERRQVEGTRTTMQAETETPCSLSRWPPTPPHTQRQQVCEEGRRGGMTGVGRKSSRSALTSGVKFRTCTHTAAGSRWPGEDRRPRGAQDIRERHPARAEPHRAVFAAVHGQEGRREHAADAGGN